MLAASITSQAEPVRPRSLGPGRKNGASARPNADQQQLCGKPPTEPPILLRCPMLTCAQCQHANARSLKFCESCGASLADVAAAERMADESEAAVMLLEVKKAQGAIGIVAVLQVVVALVYLAMGTVDTTGVVVMVGIGGVFGGLWVWCKTNPLAASIVGLLVFTSLHLTEAIIDPSTIKSGIFIKIFVVVVLVKAIAAGLKHREFVRERGMG
jgi:hypothetical protein